MDDVVLISKGFEFLLLLLLCPISVHWCRQASREGTHQQGGNLVEDVDGLLGGLLFLGAIVGGGHFLGRYVSVLGL